MSSCLKIGFLGGGKMAQAMAKGFISAGLTKSEHIVASDPVDMAKDAFKSLGCTVFDDNEKVVKNSEIVFLSVKPVIMPSVLAQIRNLSADKLFISIAMGITLQQLEKGLSDKSRVIRVMPNTPMLVKKGASVYVKGSKATSNDAKTTRQLLESVGICEEVPESYLDPVTALSGSGPAYIFVAIEALADGAVKMGLPRELAYKLASQTVLGAGELVYQNINIRHPGQLKDDVSSPAGSTTAGLGFLEKSNFRYALQGAVEAACEQCRKVSSKKD
ncbi:pyrroline-5-carboxylate reductase 3 isoform X2 [Culicoides brevitarsis]|uniref:pyrroline-5-carboxylate reductase 3 isoform X2 n=1 Tax=Culicoides brevitarsis TaxID=469753 RepID=UPI00307C1C52